MKEILQIIKDFLGYKIYSPEGSPVDITVGVLIAVIIAIVVTNFILKLVRRLVTRKLADTDKNKFTSIFLFVKYIAYVLVVIFTLDASGINITVFLAPFAALAVGLGFALQQLFQDIMSGILIITDKSLHVGDIVEVDDKVGRVTSIHLRTTRMETRGGKVLIVPNHKFMSDPLFNWTQNGNTVREDVKVGVAYGSDIELVKDLLFKCASHHPGVLEFPEPFVLFENFGDSSLDFGVYFFLPDGFTSPRIKSELRFEIDKKFRENNISIPFPQRDVHIIPQD
ncbi:mechanosensitive ion channel family protein [Sinomicrobium weinanense]|uniref:Mechanosensitive ion channel n=1 Tax=Sinomicrobium weinanense TaxID=2842200 RepID=A0A926Q459_9FLAO|nr:mechanosensitive ion channel domain-containing protein [Sinomicrobium weinanense]MBC9797619.1 mechanosensitive ion channel [Sinomicrobium weinanense]MBU3123441.1 mechanosensitive ion channel [Sinomicrobium weinanense]